jgi:hypothetical protein
MPDETVPASNWTGWISFAGMMLIVVAGFNVIEGLVTLLDDGFYLVRPEGLAVTVSYVVLGWVQIVLGLLGVAIGIGLLRGNAVARIGGVILAVVSAVVHLAAIAAYPVWSLVIIVFNIIVIFAIVVHGREMKTMW